MSRNIVFSWAENAEGEMVHIDTVHKGLLCGCTCPCCHEKLLARHGDIREHGFAHHSDTRGANLDICYMVSLYKLAEQIIQTKKRVHVQSYYGIYKETDIEFVDVKIDNRYEREDKQPDVIAITNEQEQYLIEFVFKYKVQHKRPIEYKNLTCIEIDLSNQTLDSLENFLMSSNEGRKWINNEVYFQKIEEKYQKAGKPVKIIQNSVCEQCNLSCCVKPRGEVVPLLIENNGVKYRLCRIEQYKEELEKKRLLKEQQDYIRKCKENIVLRGDIISVKQEPVINRSLTKSQTFGKLEKDKEGDILKRTCFDCAFNLGWKSKDGFACCGSWTTVGLSIQQISPEHAVTCKGFKLKS